VIALLETIKKEAKFISAAFLVLTIALKIAYYYESIGKVLLVSASIFWLFVLPGYSMLLYWQDRMGLAERMFLGTIAAFALNGLSAYYLGIIGLKIQYQTIILPAAVIAVSIIIEFKSQRFKKEAQKA
jgi:hypothetical protein